MRIFHCKCCGWNADGTDAVMRPVCPDCSNSISFINYTLEEHKEVEAILDRYPRKPRDTL